MATANSSKSNSGDYVNNQFPPLSASPFPCIRPRDLAFDTFFGALTGSFIGFALGYLADKGFQESPGLAKYGGKKMAIFSGVHSLVPRLLERLRGKDDAINDGIVGCCTGLALNFPGVISLVSATLATWYSSILIASLWKWNGQKHVTYRNLANSIFGFWGYWSVAFFQQIASLGNNIAIQIAAGSSLKVGGLQALSQGWHIDPALCTFFGVFELVLSQLPNIHSLRWVNALCTFCTIGFAATTIGVTIYDGKKMDKASVSYSLQGSSASKTFTAFNPLYFDFT